MDAIILVGGLGTRLRPLTETRHKSLVPICNRPAIDLLLEWLARYGVRRAVLAVGVGGEALADHVRAPGVAPLPVTFVWERLRLESGGAIRNAVKEARIDDRFLVVNGDIYVEFDLAAAIETHVQRGAELTLALYRVPDPSEFGVALVSEDGWVTGFVEKPPRGAYEHALVNAGVWIFERHLVEQIPSGPVRVEETLFPSLVGRGRPVLGYTFEGLWADIGTPARYLDLHRRLLRRGPERLLAPGCEVDGSASIELASLGEGCRVGPQAAIRESVLWERVAVEAGAVVEGSIAADGAVIGRGARVVDSVLGANSSVAPGSIVEGMRVPPRARYDGAHE